jgi:hypothetical protein
MLRNKMPLAENMAADGASSSKETTPGVSNGIARIVARHLFPTFPSNLEDEFKEQYNERSASVAWMGLVIGMCLYLAFYFWDRVMDSAHSTETLAVRLTVSTWFGVLLCFRRHFFTRYLQTLMTQQLF